MYGCMTFGVYLLVAVITWYSSPVKLKSRNTMYAVGALFILNIISYVVYLKGFIDCAMLCDVKERMVALSDAKDEMKKRSGCITECTGESNTAGCMDNCMNRP